MAEYRLISADSHFVEPPTMWAERLDQKFRDRAPHTVKGLNGREGERDLIHLGVMLRHQIQEIVTADTGFDVVGEVRCIDPMMFS